MRGWMKWMRGWIACPFPVSAGLIAEWKYVDQTNVKWNWNEGRTDGDREAPGTAYVHSFLGNNGAQIG